MAGASMNNSSSVEQLDQSQVNDSIDYLANHTGDKIVKTEETRLHLENVECQSDNGGFSQDQLDLLVGSLVDKKWPPALARRMLGSLVPSAAVKFATLARLAMWAVGGVDSLSRDCVVIPALRFCVLCVEYDCVSGRRKLGRLYELLLSLLARDKLTGLVASFLLGITTKKEVTEWRVRAVQEAHCFLGSNFSLDSLLYKFRTLRPDLVPNCAVAVGNNGSNKQNTVMHRKFHKIWQNRVDAADSEDNLGWDSGQLGHRVVFKKGKRDCLLPTPDSRSFASSLEQRRDGRVPVAEMLTTRQIHDNAHQLRLPGNILALLGCRKTWHLLTLGQGNKEMVERFSMTLYHTLYNEFLADGCGEGGGKDGKERRRRRQENLLQQVAKLQDWLTQGIPVIGRFLTEFLAKWDGETHFVVILQLLSSLQLTDYRELYDCVLAPIERFYRGYTDVEQLVVLRYISALHRHWIAIEYPRFRQMEGGMFPSSTFNCEDPFQPILDLGTYIGELAALSLSQCRARGNDRTFLVSEVLTIYRTTTAILLNKKVPARLEIPPCFVHESLFSRSSIHLSQVCGYMVNNKKRVIPALREAAKSNESDSAMADQILQQVDKSSLRSLSINTREILALLSPGKVNMIEGSLFRQSWDVDEDWLSEALYLCYHPAFLPYILQYFREMGVKSGAEAQEVWANLAIERGQEGSVFHNNSWEGQTVKIHARSFYKKGPTGQGSDGSSVVAPSVGDVDHFLQFLSTHLPAVTDFISVFRTTAEGPSMENRTARARKAALSDASHRSERTESSGVSSMIPKSKNLKQQVAATTDKSTVKSRPDLPPPSSSRPMALRSTPARQATEKRKSVEQQQHQQGKSRKREK